MLVDSYKRMKPHSERKRLFDETTCNQSVTNNSPCKRNAIFSSYSSSKRLKLQQSLYKRPNVEIGGQSNDVGLTQKLHHQKSNLNVPIKARKGKISKHKKLAQEKREARVFHFKCGGTAKLKRNSLFCCAEKIPILRPTQQIRYEDIEADRKIKSIFDEVLEEDDEPVEEISTAALKLPAVSNASLMSSITPVTTVVQPKKLTGTKSVELPAIQSKSSDCVSEKKTVTNSTLSSLTNTVESNPSPGNLSSVTQSVTKQPSVAQVPDTRNQKNLQPFNLVATTCGSVPNQTSSNALSIVACSTNNKIATCKSTASTTSVTGVMSFLTKPPLLNTSAVCTAPTLVSTTAMKSMQPNVGFGAANSEKHAAATSIFSTSTVSSQFPKSNSSKIGLNTNTATFGTGNNLTNPAFNFTTSTTDKTSSNTAFSIGSIAGASIPSVKFSFGTQKADVQPGAPTPFGFPTKQQDGDTTNPSLFQFGAKKSEVTPQMSVTTPFNQTAGTSSQFPSKQLNFGQQSNQPNLNQFSANNPQSQMPTTNAPTFNFGSSNAGKNLQSSMFNFGRNPAQQPSTSGAPLHFGASDKQSSTSGGNGFTFGAQKPQQSTQAVSTPFKFGSGSQSVGKPPTVNFGVSQPPQEGPSFNFGSSQVPAAQPTPAANFSFGASTQNQMTPQKQTPFQFGSNTKTANQGFAAFGLQAQPSANSSSTGNIQSLLQSSNPSASSTPFKFPHPSTGMNMAFGGSNPSPTPLQQNLNSGSFNMGSSPATRRRVKATRRTRK